MILFRSLFLQLIGPYLVGTAILTFALSLETIYRLINLIITKGVSVFSVIMMLIYRMPQFLSITLPLAMLIAAFMLMVRLSSDLEITAMRASGISYWRIGFPILIFGLVSTLATYILTLWLQPAGFSAYEAERLRVLKSQTASNITPRVLNYDFSGQVIYVQDKEKNEELVGIFITDQQQKKDSIVIMSDRGRLQVRDEQHDIILQLFNGSIYANDKNSDTYRTLIFKNMNYAFKLPSMVPEDKGGHIWGMSTEKLLLSRRHSSKVEFALRMTTPWACLGFALGAISLGVTDPRRGRSGAYVRALILVTFYYILWLGFKEFTRSSEFSPQVLWLPPAAIFFYGLYSLYKLENNLESPKAVFTTLFNRS